MFRVVTRAEHSGSPREMSKKPMEREAWLRHAQAWKESGLSCAEYSSREGLTPSTLSWWAWKLRKGGESIAGGKKEMGSSPARGSAEPG